MDRVTRKIALASGAASGLGEAIARLLAQEGATVVLAELNDTAGRRVLRGIKAKGGNGLYVHFDVANGDPWIIAMAVIRKRFGRLNIAVNCAGINIGRSFPSDTLLADWRALMPVNLDGVFLGTKHTVAAMRDSDPASGPVNGSIINISSIMGLVGCADIAAYNASKDGMRMYSKSVAISCAEKHLNIRVNRCIPASSTRRCCAKRWAA